MLSSSVSPACALLSACTGSRDVLMLQYKWRREPACAEQIGSAVLAANLATSVSDSAQPAQSSIVAPAPIHETGGCQNEAHHGLACSLGWRLRQSARQRETAPRMVLHGRHRMPGGLRSPAGKAAFNSRVSARPLNALRLPATATRVRAMLGDMLAAAAGQEARP